MERGREMVEKVWRTVISRAVFGVNLKMKYSTKQAVRREMVEDTGQLTFISGKEDEGRQGIWSRKGSGRVNYNIIGGS